MSIEPVPATGRWPALAALLATQRTPRTGSLIITLYGDAIVPRGGEAALPALLALMRRLGLADGVVRTAVSRLMSEGWLDRTRAGQASFYRLGRHGIQEFAAATHRIYGPVTAPWDGQLRIVFTDAATDRNRLEASGYAQAAPGVLVAPDGAAPPRDAVHIMATGEPNALRTIGSRCWPLAALAETYSMFLNRFADLGDEAGDLPPLEAAAARVLLVHEYRRLALRDPHLPAALLPEPWPGYAGRALCVRLYAALADASEEWLDTVRNTSGPLPRGPDPRLRFSDGDR